MLPDGGNRILLDGTSINLGLSHIAISNAREHLASVQQCAKQALLSSKTVMNTSGPSNVADSLHTTGMQECQ